MMSSIFAPLQVAPDAESIGLKQTKPAEGASFWWTCGLSPFSGLGSPQTVAFSLRRALVAGLLGIILCFVSTGFAHAQRTITQDEVNAVAERMYCPVCENIPLDDCGTATCQAWKDEIHDQLAAGQSADSIIADFVTRYGEQVVGIPQNPILRALSLITPWILVGLALVIGVWTFRRWQVHPPVTDTPASITTSSDVYRSRIDQDVG